MQKQTIVILVAIAIGLFLGFFGPKFAPNVFTPSTRSTMNVVIGLGCLYALYIRRRDRRQNQNE